jgi:hypothetical protein
MINGAMEATIPAARSDLPAEASVDEDELLRAHGK